MINPSKETSDKIMNLLENYYNNDTRELPWKRYIKDRRWGFFLEQVLKKADQKDLNELSEKIGKARVYEVSEVKNAMDDVIDFLNKLRPTLDATGKMNAKAIMIFLSNASAFDPRTMEFKEYNKPTTIDVEKKEEVVKTEKQNLIFSIDKSVSNPLEKKEKELVIGKINDRLKNLYARDNNEAAWKKDRKDSKLRKNLDKVLQYADLKTLNNLFEFIKDEQKKTRIFSEVSEVLGNIKKGMPYSEKYLVWRVEPIFERWYTKESQSVQAKKK